MSNILRKKEADSMKNKDRKTSSVFLYIAGGLALGAVAAGLILNIPDIKRYIKISTM